MRDRATRVADALGEAVADEKLPDVILLGDLNGTMNDRSLANITSQMRSTQGAAGHGFGFSWPAAFPTARIDQILVRGVEPTDSWVLPATGSDAFGSTTDSRDKDTQQQHIWIWVDAGDVRHRADQAELVDTIAHEAVHVAGNILERCAIEQQASNGEPFAYLVGWVSAWLWRNLPR